MQQTKYESKQFRKKFHDASALFQNLEEKIDDVENKIPGVNGLRTTIFFIQKLMKLRTKYQMLGA